jgi:excisionase family DNA binding protein
MRRDCNHPPEIPDRLLVDQRTAAKLLCVSIRTLWTLAQTGEIPRLKIGKSVRFAMTDLLAFIDRKRAEGGAK